MERVVVLYTELYPYLDLSILTSSRQVKVWTEGGARGESTLKNIAWPQLVAFIEKYPCVTWSRQLIHTLSLSAEAEEWSLCWPRWYQSLF